jgi:dolichol kinase
MKNSLLLSINIGLLISYVFTYFCHNQIYDYTKDLSEELSSKYENIRKERMNHLGIGIFIAVMISSIFYCKTPPEISKFQKINIITLLLLLLPMVVYKLLPKSDYMLKHSQTEQDYKDWFNIYLCMKNKSVYGFLLGFAASILILSLTDITLIF